MAPYHVAFRTHTVGDAVIPMPGESTSVRAMRTLILIRATHSLSRDLFSAINSPRNGRTVQNEQANCGKKCTHYAGKYCSDV